MNVIKCTKCNLHYDVDKYSICPHCTTNGNSILQDPQEKSSDITKKSKRGFFGKKEKIEEDNIHTVCANSVSKTWGAFEKDNDVTISSDIFEKSDNFSSVVCNNEENEEVPNDITEKFQEQDDSEEGISSSQISLTEEIKNINKNNTGRTLGYFNLGISDETPNVAPNAAKSQIQSIPVVGWLVCTKGNHLGESFQLFDGNNSIGRGSSNDLILSKERSVSSNKHAIITYEPRKRVFYVQAGDSHGLTYLNDEMVMSSQKIKAYDLIEFGDSAFVFIPLCGEQFSWEDYIGR